MNDVKVLQKVKRHTLTIRDVFSRLYSTKFDPDAE